MADKENSPPHKKARYLCKFSEKIAQEYPDIAASKQGDTYAFCKVCKVDISIANGGKYDVKQHVAKAKHKTQKQAAQTSNKISQFYPTHGDTDVIRAEMMFANFIAHHNISYKTLCITNGKSVSLENFFNNILYCEW